MLSLWVVGCNVTFQSGLALERSIGLSHCVFETLSLAGFLYATSKSMRLSS